VTYDEVLIAKRAASALLMLDDGGFAMAGFAENFKGFKVIAGVFDAWLLRADAAGKQVWSFGYGGAGVDIAADLVALPDGGFAVAGVSNSSNLIGEPKIAGGSDAWLFRTDSKGALLWNRTFGGEGDDSAVAVVVAGAGGFAIGGTAFTKGLPGAPNINTHSDFWLIRTDAAGKPLWDKTFGSAVDDIAHALVATADGGFALAGSSGAVKPVGPPSDCGCAALLVRTDGNGVLLWQRNFSEFGARYAQSVAQTADGFILAGVAGGADSGLAQKYLEDAKFFGATDLWLLRVDAAGNPLWSRTFGGSSVDYALAVQQLTDGGFAASGTTFSKVLPGGPRCRPSRG